MSNLLPKSITITVEGGYLKTQMEGHTTEEVLQEYEEVGGTVEEAIEHFNFDAESAADHFGFDEMVPHFDRDDLFEHIKPDLDKDDVLSLIEDHLTKDDLANLILENELA